MTAKEMRTTAPRGASRCPNDVTPLTLGSAVAVARVRKPRIAAYEIGDGIAACAASLNAAGDHWVGKGLNWLCEAAQRPAPDNDAK